MDPNVTKLATDTNKQLLWLKGEFLMVVISDTVYFILLLKSIKGLIKTKDWHFLFLIVASSFAFSNNTNDIYYRITAPIKKFNVRNCNETFLTIFKISASLNWVPISYYQISRLYRICENYYKRNWYYAILIISAIFSLIYSTFYFLNLVSFSAVTTQFGGCVVSNSSNYVQYVEIFDIVDTAYSLFIVCWTLFISLKNLKRYKLRHLRIKSFFDENLLFFFILVASKFIFYQVIEKRASSPGGDIWWDGLSIVVLTCAYRLMNLKPRLNEKLDDTMYQGNQKLFNEISNLQKKNRKENENNENKTKKKKSLMRNSKGEINFPSLIKKDNAFNMNQNHFIFNNRYGNIADKPYNMKYKKNLIEKDNKSSEDDYIQEITDPQNLQNLQNPRVSYNIGNPNPFTMAVGHGSVNPINKGIHQRPMKMVIPPSTSPYNMAQISPYNMPQMSPYNMPLQGSPSSVGPYRYSGPVSEISNIPLNRSYKQKNKMPERDYINQDYDDLEIYDAEYHDMYRFSRQSQASKNYASSSKKPGY